MGNQRANYRHFALLFTAAALMAASCVPPRRPQPPHPPRPQTSSVLFLTLVPLLQQVEYPVELHRIIDVRR